jgi:hypothetical protein
LEVESAQVSGDVHQFANEVKSRNATTHEVLPFDWEQYLKFADLHLR